MKNINGKRIIATGLTVAVMGMTSVFAALPEGWTPADGARALPEGWTAADGARELPEGWTAADGAKELPEGWTAADGAKDETSSEYKKITLGGKFVSAADGQITLNNGTDFIINTNEDTLFLNESAQPISLKDIKKDTMVDVVADMATTKSIPTQNYGYIVIAKVNADKDLPIYMEASKVSSEGNDVKFSSADGMYEVTLTKDTEVNSFKTKNIIKANDITVGSTMLVYSDVMTLSLPAYMTPTKVVVLSIEETTVESEKDEISAIPTAEKEAEALKKANLLKGTENGLELDREVTRAEAVTMIDRLAGGMVKDVRVSDPKFNDISGHWAMSVINKLCRNGYINGTSDTTFEPDRTVTGAEFAKILLSVMGYEDVTLENAYDKAVEAGILSEDYSKLVTEKNVVLKRSDVSRICYNSVSAKCKDGEKLGNKLVSQKVLTEKDFNAIFNAD